MTATLKVGVDNPPATVILARKRCSVIGPATVFH